MGLLLGADIAKTTPSLKSFKFGEFLQTLVSIQGQAKKHLPKFSDTCSVRADGLCTGCLGQWAERGRENSNMQEFFCTTLYIAYLPTVNDTQAPLPLPNNIDGRGRDGTSGTEGRIGGTGGRVQYRDNALERRTHEAEDPCPVWSVARRRRRNGRDGDHNNRLE